MTHTPTPRPPPCRAEHVGSLLRPPRLIDAHTRFARGTLTQAELDKCVAEEVGAIVRFQQQLGFKCVTDGEFGRYMFYDGFFDGLEGMELVRDPSPELFQDWLPHYAKFKQGGPWKPVKTWRAAGKIGKSTHQYLKWFNLIKHHVAPEDVRFIKMTMISPDWYHITMGSNAYSKEAYADDDAYFMDIAAAYRRELAALYAAGCRNVQIDAPLLAAFCSEHMRAALRRDGYDPDERLDWYLGWFNVCLGERPGDMVVGVHLCRGNSQGQHFYEGGYEAIAQRLFNKLEVDCFYLEYDSPRAGGLEPLRYLPAGKTAILGLISTKTPEMEDPARIKVLLDEAARIIGDEGKERLCLSPQCGFASRIEGNPVTQEVVERKLRLVAEIAQEVWGTLV
ncbi:UROD/MetE-like protein [Calocera viscosa TUFC12733]|uniref:UROD/MetE-like protein n=1 Tax=Calocera viscosa (strain TUFC12733) TaxID=1330018 RepID=A0A167NLX0_CALVF|nr:UROD/MetE-like protein [Calocera viscosa TUFC12733]